MKLKLFAILSVLALLFSLLAAVPASAGRGDKVDLPIAVDIDPLLKGRPAPEQPSAEEAAEIVLSSTTTASQCLGDDSFLVITIPSFDPAHPGSQDVVFWKETPAGSTGKATLWVAWDFLSTDYGQVDEITCDQLAYLQGQMDGVVATDVNYFGDYIQRPAGNENIDVMIYNIVDESYFDPDVPFFVQGFFWAKINEDFDRNMIFIDTWDWANRLGPDVLHPYDYEGAVAHELEHLIHNDHDSNELSWVDEGLADLSGYLNGFGHPASHVVYYLAFHRTSLTKWGGGLEDYGASYLFQLYLLENFGSKNGVWNNGWTRGLVDEPLNSIAGIEAQSGASMSDLYDAWILANYLDDPSLPGAGGFPLGYEEIDLVPYVSAAYAPWSIARGITDIYGSDHQGSLPTSRYWGGYVSGTVEYPVGALDPYAPLYGTYKGIQPEMDIFLRGDTESGVAPYEGDYEVASGAANMLTDRMLELTVPVSGTLTFWTWYDIETEWDYGFVEVSSDGGSVWSPISGTITTYSENPNGSTAWANSLVGGQASTDTAITGSSGGWVGASFELGDDDVLLRFSYYTDESTLGAGWFIDDVAANGFTDGFEAGAGNWDIDGWSWTTGLFENDWLVAYVNPIYNRGKFDHLEYGYFDTSEVMGSYEYESGLVDTSDLVRDEATVVITNRPGESPFASNYLFLIEKGDASP
jgi:hypothetical protein